MWRPNTLTLLSPHVKWCKYQKLMRQFKMQISTQTDKQNWRKKMLQLLITAFWEKLA